MAKPWIHPSTNPGARVSSVAIAGGEPQRGAGHAAGASAGLKVSVVLGFLLVRDRQECEMGCGNDCLGIPLKETI